MFMRWIYFYLFFGALLSMGSEWIHKVFYLEFFWKSIALLIPICISTFSVSVHAYISISGCRCNGLYSRRPN